MKYMCNSDFLEKQSTWKRWYIYRKYTNCLDCLNKEISQILFLIPRDLDFNVFRLWAQPNSWTLRMQFLILWDLVNLLLILWVFDKVMLWDYNSFCKTHKHWQSGPKFHHLSPYLFYQVPLDLIHYYKAYSVIHFIWNCLIY